MKKLSLLLFVLAISMTSCKNDKKTKDTTPKEAFIVKPEGTSVKWTAYKTTEKKPVSGTFNTLNFDAKSGDSAENALNNLSFSIPVSSIFSKNEARDSKLVEFFFKTMLNTEFLKGTIKHVNGTWLASITMNGVTHDLPLDMSITEGRRVTFKGTMMLKEWNALDAVASLNKVCFDLHKGADGVSKTWDDVAIEVSTFLRKN